MAQTRGITKRKPSKKTVTAEEAVEIRKQMTPTKRAAAVVAKSARNPVQKPTPTRKTSARKVSTPARDDAQGIRPNIITENEIMTASTTGELVALINQLTSTVQDEIFKNYKAKTTLKMVQDEARIQELVEQLDRKQQIIDKLIENGPTEHNSVLSAPPPDEKQNLYIAPIRKKKNVDDEVIKEDDVTKELETIGISLDMLQLLTGLRITNYEEDDTQFYFDVEQSSTSDKTEKVVVDYRLIIAKKFSSVAEINYIPTFLAEKKKRETLLEVLPEYFCDKLTFPYNTLSQFYTKMSKALNKGPRK